MILSDRAATFSLCVTISTVVPASFALIGAELSKYVERKFINVSYYNYLVEYVASEQYMDFTYLDESNKEIRIYETMEKAYAEQYGVLDEHNHKIVKAH